MPDNVFKIVITALDHATGPLKAINLKINTLTSPLRDVGKGIAELGEAAGIGKLAEAARGAGERFGELREKVSSVLGPLEMLGAAATIGGLGELVKHAAEYGAGLYDASLKTGVAADQLAKWHFAAQLTGTSAETLDKGLERLNHTIGQSIQGKNQQAAIMFSRLGISLRDAKGHILGASDVMGQLAAGVKKNAGLIGEPQLQQIAEAMGMKSGSELLPLLRLGKDGIAAMGQEAEHFGLVLGDEATKSAKEFDDSLKTLGFATQGLSNAIGQQLFPVLGPMIDATSEWIAANRVLIGTKVADFAKGLGDTLKSINWSSIGTVLGDIGAGFKFVASWLGPTATTLAVATVATAPLIVAFAGAAKSLVLFGQEILMIGVRMGALAFTEIIGAVGMFVEGIQAGLGPLLAFDAALDANPIGLAIIGITALAGAAFLIYENWAPIKDFIRGLWDGIVAIIEGAWSHIKPIIDLVSSGAEKLVHLLPSTVSLPNAVALGDGSVVDQRGTATAPAPRLYGQGAAAPSGGTPAEGGPAAAGAAPAEGGPASSGGASWVASAKHELHVIFDNTPPGTRVSSRATGAAEPADVDVGYGFAGAF